MLTVTDACTHYHWSIPLQTKGEAATHVHELITQLPATWCAHFLCTDNRSEFKGTDFESWLHHEGITHQLTPPYTPTYIMLITRCILYDAGLGTRFWAEAAVLHTTTIINTSPTRSNPDHKSPHKLWHGTTLSTCHFSVFGSAGSMMSPGKHWVKLDACTMPVCFLGPRSYSSQLPQAQVPHHCQRTPLHHSFDLTRHPLSCCLSYMFPVHI